MTTIPFMSANFVARELGYHMTEGWAQGDLATNDYFRPLDTFAERFDALLGEIRSLGFTAVDIWLAHLNWAWATEEHIARARALLDRHTLPVASIAGGFGATADEFDAACRLAVALGATVLGGTAPVVDTDREAAVTMLRRYGLRLGIENHPGVLTPGEILAKVGDGGGGAIGATVDTGWFGTAGLDAVAAIEALGDHIVHVHLKDVRAPGSHVTCRYGQGCVPVEGCVHALQRIGYRGGISVEHEPPGYNPGEDCQANLALLQNWIANR